MPIYLTVLKCQSHSNIGLKVEGNPRKIEFWKEVVEKVRRKHPNAKGRS